MLVFAIAFMLLLVPAAFSTFNDYVSVQVVDMLGRPVQNATVFVTYQRDSLRGLQTISQLSDALGMASFTIENVEIVEGEVDKTVTIRVLYGYKGARREIEVYQHPSSIIIQTELYLLKVKVTDQRRAPLLSRVSAGNFTGYANANGDVAFLVPPGDTTIIADFSNGQQVKSITVRGDTSEDIIFPVYNPIVKLMDDTGEPVKGYVTLLDRIEEADELGMAKFKDYVGPTAVFTAQSKGFKQTARADLSEGTNIIIFFDMHPPEISNIIVERLGDRYARVRAMVAESGIYGSGMGELSDVYVDYVSGSRHGRETMYMDSNSIYEAELDVGLADSLSYIVYAIDNAGNRNSVAGSAVLVILDTNSTSPGIIGGNLGSVGMPLPIVLGGVVVLAAVAIGAYLYLTREKAQL